MLPPNRTPAATDVRRCAACGQPTLVCEHEWRHRFAGIETPSRTFDLHCQSCGVKVTLHPHTKIAAEYLFACLMIPAIFPAIYFFASARRKARAWTDNPIVGGLHHVAAGPPERWCVCGRPAPCVRIFQRRANGLPVGTRREYSCATCSRSFVVPDIRSVIFSIFTATMLSGVGALIIVYPPGRDVGAEASNQWFGVAFVVFGLIAWILLGLGIRARMIHPECTST